MAFSEALSVRGLANKGPLHENARHPLRHHRLERDPVDRACWHDRQGDLADAEFRRHTRLHRRIHARLSGRSLVREGHILLCLDGRLDTERKDGRKFVLTPGRKPSGRRRRRAASLLDRHRGEAVYRGLKRFRSYGNISERRHGRAPGHPDCHDTAPSQIAAARKTNHLRIVIFGLQRAAGPYRWARCGSTGESSSIALPKEALVNEERFEATEAEIGWIKPCRKMVR